jgi:uncharacterized protein (TIGR02246 family)
MKPIAGFAIFTLASFLSSVSACGTDAKTDAQETALINNAKAFADAFQKGDAKAVAAFWAEDGDYVDYNAHRFEGCVAIENAFKEVFAENKDLKLRIEIDSLRFVMPDVVIEDGTTSVIPPDGGPPSQARYTNLHIKKDGQWVLQSVREALYSPPGSYEHLRGLERAVGDWADEQDGPEVSLVSFEWSSERNFLISTQSVTVGDTLVSGVTEWIGWDPATSQLRSWSFEANGGTGQGVWSNEGNEWIIKTNVVLPDGKKLSATNVVTRNGPDAITWQSKDRTLDGEALPNAKKITMKRVPSTMLH